MKKIFILLAFFSFSLSFSQAPEGMVLIKNFEKVEVKDDLEITINHELIQEALTEFENSARYSQVNYQESLRKINAVRFVQGDLNFRTRIEGGNIYINSIYTEFPNLARVMILQALGEFMGLEKEKEGWQIMSDRWGMNPQFEGRAYILRQHHAQKSHFFKALANKHPLTYKF